MRDTVYINSIEYCYEVMTCDNEDYADAERYLQHVKVTFDYNDIRNASIIIITNEEPTVAEIKTRIGNSIGKYGQVRRN